MKKIKAWLKWGLIVLGAIVALFIILVILINITCIPPYCHVDPDPYEICFSPDLTCESFEDPTEMQFLFMHCQRAREYNTNNLDPDGDGLACDYQEITNFQECIDAGNPAMESYPRQCSDPISDRTFTEVIDTSNLPPPPMPPSIPNM